MHCGRDVCKDLLYHVLEVVFVAFIDATLGHCQHEDDFWDVLPWRQ
jgi:hypothetical protein